MFVDSNKYRKSNEKKLSRASLQQTARQLSTAALPEVAPLKMYGIAGRYANALYAAAAKKKELLDVEKDLSLFKATTALSPTLKNFVMDPSVSRTKKVAGVMKYCDDAGASASTKNVMASLAEGGRMGEVFKVIDMYSSLLTAAKGEVDVVITSAKALEKAELDEINASITGFLPPGSKVSMTTAVDSDLVAGITIEMGDKFIDLSVASQIKRLQAMLA